MSYTWNKDAYTMRGLNREDLSELASIFEFSGIEITQIEQKLESKIDYYYLLLEHDQIIGIFSLNNIDTDLYSAKLNVKFAHQNGGLECEQWCVRRMMYLAFSVLKLHRVSWYIPQPQQKLLEIAYSVGFKREGMLRDAIRIQGHFNDVMLLSMIDHEWIQEERDHQIW